VGAASATNSRGTTPNHASHHHDGAGNASAGSGPTTNAAARPRAVVSLGARRRGDTGDRLIQRFFEPELEAT